MRLVAATLLFLVVSPIVASTAIPPTDPQGSRVWGRWLAAYDKLTELSEAGLNVSDYVILMNEALAAIDEGKYSRAEALLDEVEPLINDSYAGLSNYLLFRLVIKYVTVTAVLLVPPLFYYLFPRAYLSIWFRLRRRWVVVNGKGSR